MRILEIGAVACAGLMLGACDYSGDWLFAGAVDGVPGVVHLGELTPAQIDSAADIDQNVHYGEVGPTGTAEKGGVTFTFKGTGGHVCLWVDPEVVAWNQAVSARRPNPRWSYPDNVQDDGDIDLFAGLAAYYSGTPGETIGDFKVRYEDSLGNPVEIAFNECNIASSVGQLTTGSHAGRGMPEFCTIYNTQADVSYMVLLETWSTPLDDDRLGYGLLLMQGECGEFTPNSDTGTEQECLVRGEAVDPEADPELEDRYWFGADAVPTRAGSVEFEDTFCNEASMGEYCVAEASENDCTDQTTGCYCGDITDTPNGGSF